MRRLLLLICLGALIPSQASASPWTVPRDELSLSLGYDFQIARQEFTPDGTFQNYPLQGRFTGSSLSLSGRYGFTSRFEGAFRVTFQQLSYTSVPYLPSLEPGDDVRDARSKILSFSSNSVGIGDLMLTGRYNIHRSWWLATFETQAKIPTGYPNPTGTTVTLGDAQMDLQPSLLLGAYISQTATFARLDAGYNLRLGGPGHQATGGIKLGQFLGESLIVFAGVSGAYTLFQGSTLPTDNFIASNPDKPPVDFGPEDFTQQPLSLDRTFARLEAGTILRFRTLEFQLGYSYAFAGTNIPALHTISLASVVTIPDATQETPEPTPEPEEDEEILETSAPPREILLISY